MRNISVIALAVIPLLAAGCNKAAVPGDGGGSAELQQQTRAVEAATADASAETAAQTPRTTDYGANDNRPAGGPAPEAARRPPPVSLPMLAYAHRFMMELPGDQVRPLMNWHEQQCVQAGPVLCQVTAAEATDEDGEVSAKLHMRGDPVWLARFRGGLQTDAERVGGKVRVSGTDTEDLTRTIVDTEAAVRAKTVLRDRLQQMLKTRSGKLPDLLETEQELARVQGEIDAARSELSVMRAQVQTSELRLEYRSLPQMVPARAIEPVKQSVAGVFSIVMTMLAILITLSAVLLPIGLVALPAWLLWRSRRKPAPARVKS